MDYPVWEVGIGGGMLMAIVAVAHVIVAHFAVGGGLVIAVTETLAVKRGDHALRELARRSSLVLILVSTVFGAISGVGIWVVAGLISPGAISALIHEYVWGWAIEWVFFILEIVAALVYYTTWGKISKGAHLLVGWLYFVGAYLSLVIINGIITFQLTPGGWLESNAFWDGFFNPTYWPSALLRTGICAMMAAVFMIFTAVRSGDDGPRLVRYLGWWLAGGVFVTYAGYRWWEAQLPDSVTALFAGAEPFLSQLASTRSLVLWSLAVTLAAGVLFLIALPRSMKAVVPGVVVMLAAFTAFGSYERLREGVRKPFLIHSVMFSNGLRIADIERINSEGLARTNGWVNAVATDEPAAVGRQIFAVQCASCHTLDGYQAIRPTVPDFAAMLAVVADDPPGSAAAAYDARCQSCHADITAEEMVEMLPTADEMREDPEMITDLTYGMVYATLENLRAMGDAYVEAGAAGMVDTRELDYPYMPPFVGNDDDLENLTAYLASLGQAPGEQAATVGGGA
jgi:mono/diheme cytochrome c family protein